MNSKTYIIILSLFVVCAIRGNAQSMIEYKGIKIHNCGDGMDRCIKKFQDSLFVMSDWYIPISDSTKSLTELSKADLDNITEKAIKDNCLLIIMSFTWRDTIYFPDDLYMLGLSKKK